MYGDKVLDKDGVSAAGVFAEMVGQLEKEGLTLKQQLETIYQTYGYHVSNNSYFFSYDKSKTEDMFSVLQANYPTKLGEYEIVGVRDLNWSGGDLRGFYSFAPVISHRFRFLSCDRANRVNRAFSR